MGVHDGHRDRLRQKFAEHGLDPFADHEVLELLLFYAIARRNTNAIAHQLLEQFDSLEGVFSAPVESLERIDGIGERTAHFLHLMGELQRRLRLGEGKEPLILNSTQAVGEYFLKRFDCEQVEVIYQACLDAKGKVLKCCRLSEGASASADVNIRRVVEYALRYNASAVILAHNHPSGVALPSREDIVATAQIENALGAIGVTLVDHIIVADGDFVSMAENGTLRRRGY